MTFNTAQLGAAVKQLRVDRALTQADLAIRAGVSRRWLVHFENGQTPGAEVSKVFDVLRVMGMGLVVAPQPELTADEKELLALLRERER